MTSTCRCGGYDHRTWCPQKYLTVSWPNQIVAPLSAPIPADGALHRCYCGVPIWFGRLRDVWPDEYPQPERCWREPDGTPHKCRSET